MNTKIKSRSVKPHRLSNLSGCWQGLCFFEERVKTWPTLMLYMGGWSTEGRIIIEHLEADTGFMHLQTLRLRIRRFSKEDAPFFLELRNCETVARYQDWQVPLDEEACTAFIETMIQSHPDHPGTWFQFALEEIQSGRFIGDIGIYPKPEKTDDLELGFSLFPAYQGKGYMTEGLTGLFGYLFNQRRKKRIFATVDTRNSDCIRLLERLGFVYEKTIHADRVSEPAAADEFLYILDSKRWLA